MITDFINKIKATKKVAREKNVHNWPICVYHSFLIIIVATLFLTIRTITDGLGISGDTPINEIPFYTIVIPIFYSMIFLYFFLEKLIILNINLVAYFNKRIFEAWNRLDMYWFKKYKKSSPLTEGLAKAQHKTSKLTPRKKKLLTIAIISGFILFQLTIFPMFLFSGYQCQDGWYKYQFKNEIICSQEPLTEQDLQEIQTSQPEESKIQVKGIE